MSLFEASAPARAGHYLVNMDGLRNATEFVAGPSTIRDHFSKMGSRAARFSRTKHVQGKALLEPEQCKMYTQRYSNYNIYSNYAS